MAEDRSRREDNRTTISGGVFEVQGALGVGPGARAQAQIVGSQQVQQTRQELPEVLQAQEIAELRGQLAELRRRLNELPEGEPAGEAVALQAGLVESTLETAEPRRGTLVTLLKGLAESAKDLTGLGEFVARLIRLVSTGVF